MENELSEVVVVGKKFKTEGMEGSLQEAQDKVQWYRARLNVEVEGSEDYNYLMGKLKEWRQKEEQIKLNMELELSEAEPGSLQFIKDRQQYWNSKLQLSAYGTPEFKEAQKELAKLTKEEQKITVKMEFDGLNDLSKFGAMFDTAIAQPLEAADNVVNSIDKLTRSIKDGANEWEIFMGYISVGMSIFQGLESIMNVINTLSLLFASTSAKNAAATSAEASARTANSSAMVAETGTLSGLMATETAAVAPSLALTAATKQLAASQIFLAHAAIPFVGTSIAAGMVAEMEAVMAAIAAAGAFANGGIISAPTSIGDYALARVNGGEMILNSRQQGNLFNAIDKNRLYDTPGNIVAGEVKVKGTDLYIALKNLARTKSALGKNIGIK